MNEYRVETDRADAAHRRSDRSLPPLPSAARRALAKSGLRSSEIAPNPLRRFTDALAICKPPRWWSGSRRSANALLVGNEIDLYRSGRACALRASAVLVACASGRPTSFYDARDNKTGGATTNQEGTSTFCDSRGSVVGRSYTAPRRLVRQLALVCCGPSWPKQQQKMAEVLRALNACPHDAA